MNMPKDLQSMRLNESTRLESAPPFLCNFQFVNQMHAQVYHQSRLMMKIEAETAKIIRHDHF